MPGYPYSNQALVSNILQSTSRYGLETSPIDFAGVSLVRRPRERSRSSRPSSSRSRSRCLPSKDRKSGRRSRNTDGKESSSPLTRPLSVIAAELPHCLVPDATAFATRTIKQRVEEYNHSGKIKRPLNAFMLYRRSYQNIAKAYCSKDNHQQVSAICGLSWRNLEQPEVKLAFKDLADVERRKHGEAFPEYKYDPLHLKKGEDKHSPISLPTPDGSDVEPVNGHVSVKGGVAKRNRTNTSKYDEHSHSDSEVYLNAVDAHQPLQTRAFTSYPYWTPPSLHAYPAVYLEEQRTHADPAPFQTYPPPPEVSHLACRSSTPALCDSYGDAADHGVSYAEVFIDPSLLPCPPSMVYDISGCSVAIQGEWHPLTLERSRTEAMLSELSMPASSYDAYLRGAEGDWEVEELEEPSQFEDWMCQTGA
ncbi:hypothetical protein A9Z42_0022690 [Trichoderma parareesei]|uniref:HMG box domain-containing protein n=3 Tax=Trichoderma TaxID=5543 RepID=A0A2H2ZEZ8_TRIPA|nr:hypothetical protein A9Z42_0022690 [Trichoderma parareesei]